MIKYPTTFFPSKSNTFTLPSFTVPQRCSDLLPEHYTMLLDSNF